MTLSRRAGPSEKRTPGESSDVVHVRLGRPGRVVLRDQTRDLHAPLVVRLRRLLERGLSLVLVEHVLVAAPLAEGDQEVPDVLLKLRRLASTAEAVQDEDLDLTAVQHGEGLAD